MTSLHHPSLLIFSYQNAMGQSTQKEIEKRKCSTNLLLTYGMAYKLVCGRCKDWILLCNPIKQNATSKQHLIRAFYFEWKMSKSRFKSITSHAVRYFCYFDRKIWTIRLKVSVFFFLLSIQFSKQLKLYLARGNRANVTSWRYEKLPGPT